MIYDYEMSKTTSKVFGSLEVPECSLPNWETSKLK